MAGSHDGGHDDTAYADGSHQDGSRIEAMEGSRGHGSHEPSATQPTAPAHGADPNAHVLVADAPTPAWVLTAAGIALLTALIMGVLGVMLHDADGKRPGSGDAGNGAEGSAATEAPAEAPAHGLAAFTTTNAQV